MRSERGRADRPARRPRPAGEVSVLLDPFERDAVLARARARRHRAPVPRRRHRPPLPLAAGLRRADPAPAGDAHEAHVLRPESAEPLLDRLIAGNDLDELVREVDRRTDADDWDGLVRLRDRCRAAVERGFQLWPAASLAEYRLALRAPAAWAGAVVVEGAGRFALGPLAEVAASTHGWAELAPHLPRRAARGDGRPRTGRPRRGPRRGRRALRRRARPATAAGAVGAGVAGGDLRRRQARRRPAAAAPPSGPSSSPTRSSRSSTRRPRPCSATSSTRG